MRAYLKMIKREYLYNENDIKYKSENIINPKIIIDPNMYKILLEINTDKTDHTSNSNSEVTDESNLEKSNHNEK